MKKLLIFVLLILASTLAFSQSRKISALPTATNLNSSFVPIIQDSSGQYVNRKTNPLTISGDVVTVKTDTTSGSYIERLKIDSVGNVTFPNTNDFVVLSETTQISNSNQSVNLSINSSNGVLYSDNNNRTGEVSSNVIPNGVDSRLYAVRNNTTGILVTNTPTKNDISAFTDNVERLNIDSVGNVSFANTTNFTLDNLSSNLLAVIGDSDNKITTNTHPDFGYVELYTKGSEGKETFLNTDKDGNLYAYSLGGTISLNTDLNGSGGIERLKIDSVGVITINGRMKDDQGADVASIAGAITLGEDGNTFEITGTNAITLISNVKWQNGSVVHLLFTSTATLTDGTANSGTDIGMELAGNTNFTGSADDIVTLVLSEVGGTQRWREVSRSVN